MEAEYHYEFSRAVYEAHKDRHIHLLAEFQKKLIATDNVAELMKFAESTLALSEYCSRFGFNEHENESYRFFEYWHFRLLSAIEFEVDWEPVGRTPLDSQVGQALLNDEPFVASCLGLLDEAQSIDLCSSQIHSLLTPINVLSGTLLSLSAEAIEKDRILSQLSSSHTLLNRLIATWQHPITAAGVDLDGQQQGNDASFLEADITNWSFQLELPKRPPLIKVIHRVSERVLSGRALLKLLSNSANELPAVGELADELDRLAA